MPNGRSQSCYIFPRKFVSAPVIGYMAKDVIAA